MTSRIKTITSFEGLWRHYHNLSYWAYWDTSDDVSLNFQLAVIISKKSYIKSQILSVYNNKTVNSLSKNIKQSDDCNKINRYQDVIIWYLVITNTTLLDFHVIDQRWFNKVI